MVSGTSCVVVPCWEDSTWPDELMVIVLLGVCGCGWQKERGKDGDGSRIKVRMIAGSEYADD